MRTLTVLLAIVALGGSALARGVASDEEISLNKAPAKVRATIEAHAKGAKIEKVEITTDANGKKVYDVEIQKDGKTTEFSVSPEGKYLGIKTDEENQAGEAGKSGQGAKRGPMGSSQKPAADVKIPDPVTKTFKKMFPKGEITKVDVDVENGVTVYDLEFKDGVIEKETDITADGTMLEFTVVVNAKVVPAAVRQAIRKEANGAKITRLEDIEIAYETKDGKAIKLPKPIKHYAAEMAKGGQTTEVVVDAQGAVLEPAKWTGPKEEIIQGKSRPWNQIPAAVQATILANGGVAGPVDKERGQRNGQDVYEAPAKDKQGNRIDIVVTGDGKLVRIKTDDAADLAQEQEAKRIRGGLAALKFSHPRDITNPYLPFALLKQDVLEGKEGAVLNRVERTAKPDVHKTFKVGNQTVDTLAVEDRAFENGKLVEVALDYFAQADDGTVCYLGEDVDLYKDGKIVSHEGAWLYGIHTDQIGVLMPGKPKVGDKFQAENVPKITWENDEVVSVNETVTVPAGKFTNCVKVREKLSDKTTEFKYFAPGVGVIKEADGADEKGPTVVLIKHESAQKPAEKGAGQWRSEFKVDKKNLGTAGSNPYFILEPGYKLHFVGGATRMTMTVLPETKMVDGVETRVVVDREEVNGKPTEITRDYYAIDKVTGDVYYFGEDVDVYKGGKIVSHEGAWLSGVDGAKFGLMIPGKPIAGDRFFQERAPKQKAMDRSEVVSTSEKMTTPAGAYEKCLHAIDSSAVEKGTAHKWYAPGVGLVKDGKLALVKIEKAGGK
jgi:uncharacterized membrane protein YkoI/uncharacterized Fe-S cluster protein YjdI